jgi:chemosensory pili system protein ChpA (sensor histidine kinase/response regulator)
VVDRRETIRRVLALILESEGFQVVTTGAADAAVVVAFEIAPAAIVLDLSLAEQSALAALRELRTDARTRDLPIILLDGGDNPLADSDRALAAAVLPKPLDLDTLVARVSGLVPAHSW